MNNKKALQLQNVTVLFDIAWATYKKLFYKLLNINFVPIIVGMAALSVFSLVTDFEEIAKYLTKHDFISIVGLVFGASVITVVVSSLNYIAQILTLDRCTIAEREVSPNGEHYKSNDFKKETSIWSIYSTASKLLFPYFWVMILTGLIILVGIVLLVVPGIVFSVWFAFSTLFLILGNVKGKEALRKSKQYVKGIWVEVFIRFIAATLLGFLLNTALSLFKGLVADISPNHEYINTVLDFTYQLVITPYFVVYGYELYKDVVKVNECISESDNTVSV